MDDKRFEERRTAYRAAVETYLAALFTADVPWKRLYDAMRYSLLAGGKRVRPILTLECARLCGLSDWRRALPFACALELIHTYSLIHDDLPCMDDDALRRGKPTNHVVYDEATATLAGDALQAEAYRLIADAPGLSDTAKLAAVRALAQGSGADGMVAGQALDLSGYGCDRETLTLLCERKTCLLIRAATELGCAAAGASGEATAALARYALRLGLAFQIQDDLLDVMGDEAILGKHVGSDAKEGKTTFADLLGAEGCAREVRRLTEEAVVALSGLGKTDFLIHLALLLAERGS